MGNNYQRLFYIFQSMDNDLGNPTGYIKVEINGPTAKLQMSLNYLVYRPGMEYKLYGIDYRNDKLYYTVICGVENNNGRADIKLNLDTDNVGSNRLNFDNINIFALITQMPDKYYSVVCPLVAYKNGQVKWKQIFEGEIKNTGKEITVIPDAFEKNAQDANHENSANNIPPLPDALKATKEQINEIENFQKITELRVEEQSLFSEEGAEQDDLCEVTVGDLSDLVEVSVGTTKTTNECGEQEKTETHSAEIEFSQPENSREEKTSISAQEHTGFTPKLGISDIKDDNTDGITSKFESTLTSIYSNETEGDNFLADTDIIGTAERNLKDISSINTKGDKASSELDIGILREELDKSFESCNPFNTRSKRFVWWKINSPGYLNNILFRNNVKTYLLFNPKVMLAHYKYRYIIFGIRYDKYSGRERFVCGVPGVYSIDDNPFGSMGSWAQLEGFKPKYGAFGYWIILIDPRTGKLIKIK